METCSTSGRQLHSVPYARNTQMHYFRPCISRKTTTIANPWSGNCRPNIQERARVQQHQFSCQPCRRTRVLVQAIQLDNRELLLGDCISLFSFCLYKQITSIILNPDFPGWLAPLKFNITRFEELISFALTLITAWVLSALLVDGYKISATADLPTALTRVSWAWLISMPVAACQLVLLTAAEDHTLVTGEAFASKLPLAASGPGEPLATAAGVLGLMALWRAFYTCYLDFWNARTAVGSPVDRAQDMAYFVDSLRTAFLLSISFCIIMQFLAHGIGEENLQKFLSAVGASAYPF